MPLHRRLPKVGFVSRSKGEKVELRLHELAIPQDEVVDIDSLKRAGVVVNYAKRVKVIASGKIEKAVRTQGLMVTPGARKAIEAAGGTIED
jgi:large subunit ribosomal protein L15